MKLLIVIDNLDTERDPEISRFLLTLIDRTKSNIRWCLASRSRLDLPTASWLAYNDSDLCIDANDLRFTFDEARLGAQAAGADISDEDLRTMFRLTEGWPAALAFAFRSTTKARDLQSAAHGTREMVYRYLAEQVWGSLNSDLRDFLSIAAFLPWIDARFAAEAGYPDSDTLVENLRYHIGLLSTSREGTYELHDLFRGFIRQTLTMRGRSALEEALSRAAEVLERSGLTAAALERYIDANATPSIARLINVHNVALLETGHYDTAQRALRTLEGPELGWSGVLALRAAIEEASGRVDRAEALYSRALSLPVSDQSFRVSISCRYSLLLYQQGRTDGIPLLEALHKQSGLNTADRTHVLGTLAVLLSYTGDKAQASGLLSEALGLADVADEPLYARTYGRAAAVAFFSGDEEAVEIYATEAVRIAEQCSLYSLAARIGTSLSTLHTSAGHLTLARSHAERVVRNAERAGDPEVRARGLRELLALETELGDEDRIASVERDLAATAYAGPNGLPALLLARALRLTWHSKFDEARILLEDAGRLHFSVHQHRLRTSLLAITFAASGDTESALSALLVYKTTSSLDSDTHTMFARSRALSLRYAMLAATMISARAVSRRLAQDIARNARADQFVAFDAAIEAIRLRSEQRLAQALRALNSCSQEGVAKMISAATVRLFPSEADDRVSLTSTEMLILRLLVEGFSNQAIASAHGRTINTIRTHVSSILRKLKCESRGEAAAAARRMGLI